MEQSLKSTIIVLPLEALLLDITRRCLEFGLKVERWTPSLNALPGSSCILVSADYAGTSQFQMWLFQSRRYVRRIVVDEAHMILHAAQYRFRMRDTALVRTIDTQLVLLTGTLPPSEEKNLIEAVKCSNLVVYRQSTNRPTIKYSVLKFGTRTEALACMGSLIRSFNGQADERMIVYSRSKEDASVLCKYGRVATFTSETKEKGNVLTAWFEGKYPIISATSALSLGIDYPAVTLVVHFGSAHSLVDFGQETGRAGRNGCLAKSVVVSWQGNTCGMPSYVDCTGCRRLHLQDFLDGKGVNTSCTMNDQACDNCTTPQTTMATMARTVISTVNNNTDTGFSRQTARLARDHSRHILVSASGYLKELRQFCGACAAHGAFVTHNLFRCPRAQNRCLRCFSSTHKASKCPIVSIMRTSGICYKCHLPAQLMGTKTHVKGCFQGGQQCSVLEGCDDFALPYVIQLLSPNGMSTIQAKEWFKLEDGVPLLINLFVKALASKTKTSTA